jgi:septum formation protein
MKDLPQIYLASASPRRRELLQQLGVRFAVLNQAVPEERRAGETPEAFVERLAVQKAEAGWAQLAPAARRPVLAADTAVVVDEQVLGKPADREAALAMLALLSGRSHRVLSAVALMGQDRVRLRSSESQVSFRVIGAAEREAYWQSGEPADKAGAYAIQGLGALFVRHLAGSYSGVMGLPLFETGELLREFGIEIITARESR